MPHPDVIVEYHLLSSRILKDKTMNVRLIYIPNDDKQNCPLCRLKINSSTILVLNQPTKINLSKVPNVFELPNKITWLYNLGYQLKCFNGFDFSCSIKFQTS